MKFSILFVIFILISQVNTASLITGTYDSNSTALIHERCDIKEIDVLRQLINQETLIRVSVVKDVTAVMDDVKSLKKKIKTQSRHNVLAETIEALQIKLNSLSQDNSLQRKVEALQRQIDNLSKNNTLVQTVEMLVSQVNSIRQDNALQLQVEALQRQIDNLRKNNTLVQTVEMLVSQVNSMRQDNALQQKVESLRRQIESLSKDHQRISTNQNKIQDLGEMLKILEENITDVHKNLQRNIKQIIENGSKLNRDCMDLYLAGLSPTGVYRIHPYNNESQVHVYCDMDTEGGGWTAIQKRSSGSIGFDRTWAEYKKGFGNPSDSYWIGNDVIHQLTKGNNSSLYVSITLTNGRTLYELYHQFSISDESDNYRLYLGGPATGTLGDSMRRHNLSGMSFSTPDTDNDGWSGGNCATASDKRGGWWFNFCHFAFLNGQWSPGSWIHPWYSTVTASKQIKETLMMIKPH